jgi:hypothetical protein
MTTRRVYDRAAHRKLRARYRPIVDRGDAYCTQPECLMWDRWIEPGTPWDLAHDRDNGGYHGPAHALCNRSEGAVYGNLLRAGYW